MKKAALLFCLVLTVCRLSAQKINVDSLIRVAISRANNSGIAVPQNHDSLFKAFTLTKAGTGRTKVIYKLINFGQPTSKIGLKYHYKILDWARKNNDPISESIITAEIAFELAINGDVDQAITLDLNALKQAIATGSAEAIGIVYDSMGCCFGMDNNSIDAAKLRRLIYYFQQGLRFSTIAHNDLFISYDLGGIGAVYHAMNKPDSAEFFSFKSFEHAVRKNNVVQVSQSLLDIVRLQTSEKLKLKFAWAAVAIAVKMQDTVQLGSTYTALAKIYQVSNKADSAMYYAKKAYNFSRFKSVKDQIEPAQILGDLYAKINADSALKYTHAFYTDKDSVYSVNKSVHAQALAFADQQHQQEIETQKAAYAATLRLYILGIVIAFLLLIAFIFWRNNGRIKKDKVQIQQTLDQLKATQTQLIQSEKMASLGELTAGIAHEIQNPLNFVNNFSEVNREMIDELKEELKRGDINEALAIADNIQQNEDKINHHGRRADGIVKGMLQHSRSSTGAKEPTDLNALADEYLRLAYHGIRAKEKNFNAELVTHFDSKLPKVNVIPQDIGRVLLNLLNNAFYAIQQKAKTAGDDYKPVVEITTFAPTLGVWAAKVTDNGNGIPDAIKDKIMQPFFTTKPTGEGTGLGLSLSYDIVVKGHGGNIDVESIANEYTIFTIKIPVS